MRFYEPQSGSVLVDGRDVRCYGRNELRRRFGAAFQNDMIFRDTLRENVSFGRALDYKTDAAMRRAIFEHHPDTTVILIAQRVSSVMGMDKILVLDNGKCVGLGTHGELLRSCPSYRETYQIQMGEMG